MIGWWPLQSDGKCGPGRASFEHLNWKMKLSVNSKMIELAVNPQVTFWAEKYHRQNSEDRAEKVTGRI
jgi:hypothetical protein